MGAAAVVTGTDVHQHLWPEELLERLRSRSRPPFLRGWTLHTEGEPPFEVSAADHDVEARLRRDVEDTIGAACLSLSAPLGIESLRHPDATALITAWHDGAARLPGHFRAWASASTTEPDLTGLAVLLAGDRFVGLQVPATSLAGPGAWERALPLLAVAEQADKPVLVHPGPVAATGDGEPGWWAPVVGYTAQLQAAWWAWRAVDGRSHLPRLRLVFAAAAGLAPLHHERHLARGGTDDAVDPDVFVDTSGYGPRALDAVVRALGIDALVLGSDRPYADPIGPLFGDAATHAVRVANPARLLGPQTVQGGASWPFAS